MSTSPIDLSSGLVPKSGGINLSAGFVPKAERTFAPPSNRIADSLENATISPPETGIAASIDRFKNRVRDFMGADHKPAGDVMGGMVLGPINAAHGAAISPDHPIRGAHEIISGVGQTAALPLAVTMPGTMAYSAPSIIAGSGAREGLKALGVDDDWANIAGDAAGAYAGIKTLNPNAMKVPVRKIVQTGMAINEGIPGLSRLNKLSEAPGKIRAIWSKPQPEGEATASGPVEADNEPSPSPYRMSGDQIQDPVTVTPRRVFQPKGLLTEGTSDVPAPAEPSPAPYRSKGDQIPDATTVTPRRTFQPAGLLTDGSQPAPAPREFQLPGAPTDSDVTPGRTNLDFPRTNSGEGVLNQALTALDNKSLIKVARSRGIDVAREAQLKPGAADATIIKKIIDDFSPEELQEAQDRGIEMSRNKPVPAEGVSPEAGKEAWHYKVLNTFFPDVAMPKTMLQRAAATIAKRPAGGLREFPQPSPPSPVTDAISQATGNGQPVLPPETTEGRTFSPNASGESPASLEAINRQASERVNGVKRFRIDTRSGQETPLIGVDAVDAKAGPYDRIVQRGPQGETTLDQGPKARPSTATPKVANNNNLEDVLKRATQGLRTFGAAGGGDD